MSLCDVIICFFGVFLRLLLLVCVFFIPRSHTHSCLAGVGSDVSHHLIHSLALAGGGVSESVQAAAEDNLQKKVCTGFLSVFCQFSISFLSISVGMRRAQCLALQCSDFVVMEADDCMGGGLSESVQVAAAQEGIIRVSVSFDVCVIVRVNFHS